jgi:hypothetical protein
MILHLTRCLRVLRDAAAPEAAPGSRAAQEGSGYTYIRATMDYGYIRATMIKISDKILQIKISKNYQA